MEYLADTVTIIRHFSSVRGIGKRAKAVLNGADRGENHLYISIISLVEIMYLSQKKRIKINLEETLEIINNSENYSVVDLTPQIVISAERISFPELFDRLIIATAQYLGLSILTSDKAIRSAKIVRTIWD